MSSVYIVNHWLPFPSSEYGGMDVFIANNQEEIIQYYLDDADEYYRESYPDYVELITSSVHNSKSIPMLESLPFSLVDSFRT